MKTFNIGRNVSNDIILNDKMVSRQHAQLIKLDNGQVFIKDLGSSNGTFVNGNKITECSLKAGDIVKCGSTFVEWTRYISESATNIPSMPKSNLEPEKNYQEFNHLDIQNNPNQTYSLGESFKYLTAKVFSIGDLFKTEWNRTQAILFFFLTPIIVILFSSVYFYLAHQDTTYVPHNFAYQVILPVVISIFAYGVAQFLTLSLLSINRDTTFKKNIFASSIFGFLQFLTLFVVSSMLIPFLSGNGMGNLGVSDLHSYYIILYLVVFTLVTGLTMTLIIFLYKYFRIIGVSRGISIHFTVLTFTVNFLLQIAFTYFFVSITVKDLLHF